MVEGRVPRQISRVPVAAQAVLSGTSASPSCPARSIIERRASALREVARLFLKLGLVGFGGPAAHIALMRDEVVRRRGWMSEEEFLDAVGAVNLLPGPNSTELALHIGRGQAGVAGLLVAGACFILPPMAFVLACPWAYVSYGRLPAVLGAWARAQPVVVAGAGSPKRSCSTRWRRDSSRRDRSSRRPRSSATCCTAPGGLVATAGIFLPAFLLVGVSGAIIPWLRRSPPARAFLDGVNAGSVALMAVVTWELGRHAITSPGWGRWPRRACSCSGPG